MLEILRALHERLTFLEMLPEMTFPSIRGSEHERWRLKIRSKPEMFVPDDKVVEVLSHLEKVLSHINWSWDAASRASLGRNYQTQITLQDDQVIDVEYNAATDMVTTSRFTAATTDIDYFTIEISKTDVIVREVDNDRNPPRNVQYFLVGQFAFHNFVSNDFPRSLTPIRANLEHLNTPWTVYRDSVVIHRDGRNSLSCDLIISNPSTRPSNPTFKIVLETYKGKKATDVFGSFQKADCFYLDILSVEGMEAFLEAWNETVFDQVAEFIDDQGMIKYTSNEGEKNFLRELRDPWQIIWPEYCKRVLLKFRDFSVQLIVSEKALQPHSRTNRSYWIYLAFIKTENLVLQAVALKEQVGEVWRIWNDRITWLRNAEANKQVRIQAKDIVDHLQKSGVVFEKMFPGPRDFHFQEGRLEISGYRDPAAQIEVVDWGTHELQVWHNVNMDSHAFNIFKVRLQSAMHNWSLYTEPDGRTSHITVYMHHFNQWIDRQTDWYDELIPKSKNSLFLITRHYDTFDVEVTMPARSLDKPGHAKIKVKAYRDGEILYKLKLRTPTLDMRKAFMDFWIGMEDNPGMQATDFKRLLIDDFYFRDTSFPAQ